MNRRSKPPPAIGRVRRSIPPPRGELPTLAACLHCGGREGSAERFKFESDPELRAADPLAKLVEGPGTYSAIQGCRFCTAGTMTRAQVLRYRRWQEQRESRKIRRP